MGEIFNNNYTLLEKIGWGHFSTVWLTKHLINSKIYAMKVQKSAEHYYEAAFDEINILTKLKTHKNNPKFLEMKQKYDPEAPVDET